MSTKQELQNLPGGFVAGAICLTLDYRARKRRGVCSGLFFKRSRLVADLQFPFLCNSCVIVHEKQQMN
jgi:hypothetical protein